MSQAVASTLCEECCEDLSVHKVVTINWVGRTFDYVVPSFPVFSAVLTHMKFTIDSDENVYDGFFKSDHEEVNKGSIHIKARICGGLLNSFMIPCDEVSQSISVSGPNLKVWADAVFMMWKWTVVSVDDVNEKERK